MIETNYRFKSNLVFENEKKWSKARMNTKPR